MKSIYRKFAGVAALAFGMALTGCDDYLDITPPSQITPEVYFATADQLGAYCINYYGTGYGGAFSTFDNGGSGYQFYLDNDQGTDNEGGTNDKFFDGSSKVKVGQSGGSWYFYNINNYNYFLETVLPRYEAGAISGTETDIRHYIGEMYFLRAQEYFVRLKALGDFPIITTTLPMDTEILVEASKRSPRNVVARFILEDLDKAIDMLSDGTTTGGRVRITRDVALLLKARVALYEATFEKYFAGTPFVPDKAAGWPGASKDYNADFVYDNATEVAFFLDEALKASREVIKNHPTLTANNKQIPGSTATTFDDNQYYNLFATNNPSNMDEALMYRVYNLDVAGGHCLNQYISGGRGYTQEFANAFLMANGLPIYDANSGYAGDDFVGDTKIGRDSRWQIFMKAPGEYVYADNATEDQRVGEAQRRRTDEVIKAPALISGTTSRFTTSTGYHKAKGWSSNSAYARGGQDLTSCILFRSAEAYLIYLEAAWEKYGDALDSEAWGYWSTLRTRAGLPADAHVTINATDLDKEEYTSHDFGLYSAGQRVTSKVLYNIRRERRCELMGEGFRWDDLIRWRALDQLKTKRYFKHGCKFHGPMFEWFKATFRGSNITAYATNYKFDQADSNANNISSPTDTEGGFNGDARYYSLLRVSDRNDWYESGYSWRMAHYLNPIAENHFIESAADKATVSTSPIYQNPYWGTTHDTPAQQ